MGDVIGIFCYFTGVFGNWCGLPRWPCKNCAFLWVNAVGNAHLSITMATPTDSNICHSFIHSFFILSLHYVIMTNMASQNTSLTAVYSTVYSGTDQRKHQSPESLAFVCGIHRDRWIPRTKGQLRRKWFHLMTSLCNYITTVWMTQLSLATSIMKSLFVKILFVQLRTDININKKHNPDMVVQTICHQLNITTNEPSMLEDIFFRKGYSIMVRTA